MANDFKKAFKGIDSAIKQGTARALNRALQTTKTKMVRALREDTGLKTEVINTRTRSKKANQGSLGVLIGIAVKFQIALSKFSPLAKRVKALYSDGSERDRRGVTTKIGPNGRALVQGGFIIENPGGIAVVGRAAAFDSAGNYVPTPEQGALVKLKTDVFTKSAEAHQSDMQKLMQETFDKNVAHEIDFAIQNKFNSD